MRGGQPQCTLTAIQRGAYLMGSCRRPRSAVVGAAAATGGTSTRAFQVIKRGHDRQRESLYEKLGFTADSEAERVQRSPEELFQGLVQETMKLKDPLHDPADKARLDEMKSAYRLLQDPMFRANYGGHYYASNDAQLHVLQDGGQVSANYNPEHQHFAFVDHASGRAVPASGQAGASRDGQTTQSFGDFTRAFQHATGSSSSREARPHNAAEAAGPLGGGDIEFTVRLTFQEALNGCSKRLQLLKHTRCRRCRGSGAQPLKKPRACPQCLGRGSVNLPSGTYQIDRRCNYCGGNGHMPPPHCSACAGRGLQLAQDTEVPVTVPAQTRNLSVFHLQGLGHDGVRGGGPGALVLTVMVQEHRHLYQAVDGTLHAVLPLPLSTALLGGLVPVPAAQDDNTHTVPLLHVPPCVRSGQILRLREHGVHPPSVSGAQTTAFEQDVLFHVLVMTPRGTELSGRQREALGVYEATLATEASATCGKAMDTEAEEPAGQPVNDKDAVWSQCAALKDRYRHWLPQS